MCWFIVVYDVVGDLLVLFIVFEKLFGLYLEKWSVIEYLCVLVFVVFVELVSG